MVPRRLRIPGLPIYRKTLTNSVMSRKVLQMASRAHFNYFSPAGGPPRSTSAENDDVAVAVTILTKKVAMMVGSGKSASKSEELVLDDLPMASDTAQYQDAVFIFENGDSGEKKKIDVPDVDLAYKQPGTTNKNINITSASAAKDFVDEMLTVLGAGWSCTEAFYTRH